MDARDVYNLYEAYRSVYEDRESLNEDVDYELDEGYKKLPIDRMLYQASRHGENVGRSGGDRTTSLKRAIRVGSMMGAAENHDAEKSKEKATANFRRGASRQQNEERDLYDVVLDHLLDEGYCDDVESAEIIMANMSEEWLDGILDEAKVDQGLSDFEKLKARVERSGGTSNIKRKETHRFGRGVRHKKGAKPDLVYDTDNQGNRYNKNLNAQRDKRNAERNKRMGFA